MLARVAALFRLVSDCGLGTPIWQRLSVIARLTDLLTRLSEKPEDSTHSSALTGLWAADVGLLGPESVHKWHAQMRYNVAVCDRISGAGATEHTIATPLA